MALAPLASADALAARLGVPADDPALLDALTSASNRFREAVHHPVSLVQNDTITLDGTGSRTLLLPAAPVAVKTVTVGGAALTTTDYEVSSRSGILRRAAGKVWPDTLDGVEVTYDHGYEEVPEGIAAAVLDMAEEIYSGAPGVATMQVGAEAVYESTGGVGTSEAWQTAVDRYRIDKGDRA